MHGSGKLYWSETLAAEALAWSEYLAQNDVIEKDKSLKDSMQSESIYSLKGAKPKCQREKSSNCLSCSEIVEKFYKEGEYYEFETGKPKDEKKSIDRFARVSLVGIIISLFRRKALFFRVLSLT